MQTITTILVIFVETKTFEVAVMVVETDAVEETIVVVVVVTPTLPEISRMLHMVGVLAGIPFQQHLSSEMGLQPIVLLACFRSYIRRKLNFLLPRCRCSSSLVNQQRLRLHFHLLNN